MNNQQKNELTQIVKGIPKKEVESETIVVLWRKYGSDFEYSTFRNYLKTFRS